MQAREGLIPTVLGTAVTTSGFAMKKILPGPLAWGLVGFGLAHVVLGSIDLVEHKETAREELY
ncbi:asparagine synthase [Sporosalibacterium faouarense]|uniref:asparagine synthase n=1 Tax=Sporosalibacterium faouarense TaxID=516123 RepID=UPI00141D064E|nr:asparagine synthase [Sporosalibacterium faouarense]MTI47024.1 asparagine synthase [Bacillota bacterium]